MAKQPTLAQLKLGAERGAALRTVEALFVEVAVGHVHHSACNSLRARCAPVRARVTASLIVAKVFVWCVRACQCTCGRVMCACAPTCVRVSVCVRARDWFQHLGASSSAKCCSQYGRPSCSWYESTSTPRHEVHLKHAECHCASTALTTSPSSIPPHP